MTNISRRARPDILDRRNSIIFLEHSSRCRHLYLPLLVHTNNTDGIRLHPFDKIAVGVF
uniref:Uncharacterized protein n=1 Tax=Octopus bimaculoides TaxID=37653 RepID=A0A0L8H9U4_OCTBM